MGRGKDSSTRARGGARRLALLLWLVGVLSASASLAGTDTRRVQLEVALAGGAAPGSEGLGYFVPEVSRTLAELLRRAGVSLAGPSETGGIAVTVALEERAPDRVLVTARARGQRIELEGAVENIHALVDDLAARLVPLCLEPGIAVATVATTRNGGKTSSKPIAVALPPGPTGPAKEAAPKGPAMVAPPNEPATLPASTTAAPSSPTPTASATPVLTPTPAVTPTPAPPLAATLPSPPLTVPARPIDPYGPDARVGEPAPSSAQTVIQSSDRGYVRGRVVVHTIPEPAGGYAGAGSTATQALYAVLQRRLRLSIVPMGVGMTSLSAAADEGQRAQSRAVVMARVDALSLAADPGGQGGTIARFRLEIAVVREGRLVLRRAVLAETPAGASAPDPRRRAIDPVYLAATHALEGLINDLGLALGDLR